MKLEPSSFGKPVLGFAAYSGTGKTTLLVKLLPLLKKQGLRVSMIKHAHHDFDIDKPGKDSYELRKAGAYQVLIASSQRQALVTEKDRNEDPELTDLVAQLDGDAIDLVLVEGFRHVAFPKIELHRPSMAKDLICMRDKNVIAIASDEKIDVDGVPYLDLNKVDDFVEFIQKWLSSQSKKI